jgi:hypothetical protein
MRNTVAMKVRFAPTPVLRRDIGQHTEVAVSRMRLPSSGISQTPLAGSVSRGTCARAMGTRECLKNGCQAPAGYANPAKDCSDRNMRAVIAALGLELDQILVVGTQSACVGFHGSVPTELKRTGLHETVTDYAAFFASTDDHVAIATHMADCGFVAVEFPGAFGFMHLTRLNMAADSVAATEFLHKALAHYGASLADVQLTLVAAVQGANFRQHFADADGHRPEDRFPGWFAAGLLHNLSKPAWRPGDPLDATDTWEPDNRAMMRRLLLRTGVSASQLTELGTIDPGDLRLGHASHSAGMLGRITVARDAYIIMPRGLAAA